MTTSLFDIFKQQFNENCNLSQKWMTSIQNISKSERPDPLLDGATKKNVLELSDCNLYHYEPISSDICKVPIVIVYALVNRPYMLDLSPKRSFIRSLLSQGMDIYLIDWKDPARSIPKPTLENYIEKNIKDRKSVV